MSELEMIEVEVAYALPEKQKIYALLVEPGTTALQAAKMYPVLSQKEQEKVKQDIKANVAQAYYMVAIANKNISFLDDMMESSEKLKSYLNILAEKGMMDSAQIDQIDLNLKKFESQRRKAVLDQNLLRLISGLAAGPNGRQTVFPACLPPKIDFTLSYFCRKSMWLCL